MAEFPNPQPTPVDHGGAASSDLANAPPQDGPRFQFFLIDSGWHGPVGEVIRKNIGMIQTLQNGDPLYVLTPQQSVEVMKRNPSYIGKDPILLARDLWARGGTGPGAYHGFHLKLGVLRKATDAGHALREFLQFLAENRRSTDIEQEIKKRLHRDGLKGAVEVIRATSEAFIEG